MEKQNILSRMVIREIQERLAVINNKLDTRYGDGELLIFLRGVSYALWDKGIFFRLKMGYNDPYEMNEIIHAEVWQYKGIEDPWGGNLLFKIYDSSVEEVDNNGI